MDKVYIAVLNTVPDHMVPVLVAHSILGANETFWFSEHWNEWKAVSFKKCVISVNEAEFEKIKARHVWHGGHENTVLDGSTSCLVVCPDREPHNVLKFAKLWKPK